MSGPVPHHLRNPRRAYDHDGTEIPPATVRSCAVIGAHSIQVFCHACDHTVILGLDGLPDALPIPDVPVVLRLRCGACASTSVGVMMDMTAHYANVRAHRDQAPDPLPAGYRVVPWREIVGAERGARLIEVWVQGGVIEGGR